MRVLRILVFCALVFIIRCENSRNLQIKSSTLINTRCRRESEIDVRSRESKIKVPYLLKSTIPMIPTTERLNLINKYPHNALPRRQLSPVVSIPKLLSNIKDSVKKPENDHNNYYNLNTDTRLEPDVKTESIKAINSTQIDNLIKNNGENNENKEVKVKPVHSSNSELNTDKGIEYDVVKNTVPVNGTINEIKSSSVNDEADLNEDKDKNNQNKGDPTKADQILTKNLETLKSDPIEKLPPANLLSKLSVTPEIPIQTSRMSDEESGVLDKDNSRYSKSYKTETTDKPSSLLESDPKIKERVDESAPKKVSLANLSDEGKMPIKIAQRINPLHVPLYSKPSLKTANESPAIITQKNNENQISRSIEKPGLGVLIKRNEFDPDEIVIQNNNYEELFETSTPQYMIPQLISSDLRSAPNSNSFNRIPPYYEEVNIPYESKSYPYEVKKYPNQYVVDAYDDTENGRRNIVESQKWMNNRDQLKYIITKNVNPWRQHYSNYNHPQTENFEQQYSIGNNQIQGCPKMIWKSWNNNQIFIRPKYRNVSPDLYDNISRYNIANANGKGAPIYASNRIGYGAYENQNTSPHMNSFQYRRYGY